MVVNDGVVKYDGDGSLFPVVEFVTGGGSWKWMKTHKFVTGVVELDVLFWFVCFLHQFFFGV